MNDEERLELMEKRILHSFKWIKDVTIPVADEFGITAEELEEIFMNTLDMSSLEALHSTFDSANYLALKEQIYIDLRLCWFSGTLELITDEEAEDIKTRLADAVYDKGRNYEEVLDEGRKEILALLRSVNIKEE
ncbi:DUF1959 family protein [uncultured Methanobrevibacter sp.]|uniref:DUF1959 family protein n=1 Tax=uncultured Methanobrevibacter sp. TaxID=253161 RepID=UPI0026DEC926|nr:DUF1959 family protein [uncultured Methanobrevibacter sp.]